MKTVLFSLYIFFREYTIGLFFYSSNDIMIANDTERKIDVSIYDGISAINLEMPARVPRTEYSVTNHYGVLNRVTGLYIDSCSSIEDKSKAEKIFMKKWNFDFIWNILTGRKEFGTYLTSMGHGVYDNDGQDFNDKLYCPFKTPEQVYELDPFEQYGYKNINDLKIAYENNYREKVNYYGDAVNMTGIYISCISGLLEILGWDMFLLAAGYDPGRFSELVNRYHLWIGQYFNALAQTDIPYVMIHDDIVWASGPFMSPSWYREVVFPGLKRNIRMLADSGKKVCFTSDGNYTVFIDDIADMGVHGFVLEPLTDMEYIAHKYGRTKFFIGNADTRILLSGSKDDIENEVLRCIKIGKKCPGFFMAVGNHIPSNTPVDNVLYYNEFYEKHSKRR